jgi:hypothetical protein
MAERPCGSAKAGRGVDTIEGVSSRSSIFSLEEMAPLSEGTVERFWSLGETDLVSSREARGAEAGSRNMEPTAGAEGRHEAPEVGTDLAKALPAPT